MYSFLGEGAGTPPDQRTAGFSFRCLFAAAMEHEKPFSASRKQIKHLTHAMRLSPLDPLSFRAQGGIAFAHFLADRYDEASLWAEKALRERPNYLAAIRELAAANALGGRLAEAQKAMAHLREVDPAMRVSTIKDWVPLRRPEDLARLEEGLRKAGLPE
jgi:hypothetical protein